MPKVTLTRFDFHAYDFLHSETVRAMDAQEVGQYVLLLCEAWCGGKDTTLPVDEVLLGRYARGAVGARLLEKFPIVDTEWGPRRRNPALFREWQSAMGRSAKKRDAAAVRWGSTSNADAMQVHEKPDALHMPISYHIISDQPDPNQTEPNGDETMSMKNRINQAAGRKVVDSRNNADFNFLATRYGKEAVVVDFLVWYNALPDDTVEYPGSAYLKIADSRLQSGAQSAIIQNDPRITELVAFVYARTQRAARAQDVTPLLTQYELSEIQDAFNAFTEGLDDNELKWAPKNFFQDGAGAGIILARRLKKAADDLAQKTEVASVEAGRAERKADEQKLLDKRREEDEAAARLGDNPF